MEGKYQVVEEIVRIHVSIPQVAAENASKNILFVLDNSYSMNASWNSIKEAVEYMLALQAFTPHFIVYSTTAARKTGAEVLKMDVDYTTNFVAAFEEIEKFVNETNDKNIDVVFMTDGCDTCNDKHKIVQQLKSFSHFLAESKKGVTIHTIGFTQGHNEEFLKSLNDAGTRKGVYRYSEEGSTLSTKFMEFFDFLSLSFTFEVNIEGLKLERYFSNDEVNDRLEMDEIVTISCFSPACQLKIKEQKPLSISIHYNNNNNNNNNNDNNGDDGGNGEEGKITKREVEFQGEIEYTKADLFFILKRIEEMEIQDVQQLMEAQKILSSVVPTKAISRIDRLRFFQMKSIVQAKLDQYFSLFADASRGKAESKSIAAQLSSLRHETKFTKARRGRAMDQRATGNVNKFANIDQRLEDLHMKMTDEEKKEFGEIEIQCILSGESYKEVMETSFKNIFVFPLQITRPELVVDSPSLIVVNKCLVGHYTLEAFEDSLQFSINQMNTQRVLGGFTENKYQAMDENYVGVFKGPDGESMNACLPLYLSPSHWKRVEAQIEPILGYFFTMDPFGFKGDQYIALYSVLGQLLIKVSTGEIPQSEYVNWLIDDFSRLCSALLPKSTHYLSSLWGLRHEFLNDGDGDDGNNNGNNGCGGSSNNNNNGGSNSHLQSLVSNLNIKCNNNSNNNNGGNNDSSSSGGNGGNGGGGNNNNNIVKRKEFKRGDLAEDFVYTIVGRSKDFLQSLSTLIGWNQCTSLREKDTFRFDIAFIEELWRRNLTEHFRGQPRDQINEWLEMLLFEANDESFDSLNDGESVDSGGGNEEKKRKQQRKKIEEGFATYAKAKFGFMSKSKTAEILKASTLNSLECHSLLKDASSGGGGVMRRKRKVYDEERNGAEIDRIIENVVLKAIEKRNAPFAAMFGNMPFGEKLEKKLRWVMIAQALQYSSNSLMNKAIDRGDYKNTYDWYVGNISVDDVFSYFYEIADRQYGENYATYITTKNTLTIARQIVYTNDLFSFAGKILKYCPTRGGKVFESVVGLMTSVSDKNLIPHYFTKARAIMTGKIVFHNVKIDGFEDPNGEDGHFLISNGESWVFASLETVKKFKDVLGDDEWIQIEVKMHGKCCWVYRASDIPNRHGYHNSHPNPSLGVIFKGFKL